MSDIQSVISNSTNTDSQEKKNLSIEETVQSESLTKLKYQIKTLKWKLETH